MTADRIMGNLGLMILTLEKRRIRRSGHQMLDGISLWTERKQYNQGTALTA